MKTIKKLGLYGILFFVMIFAFGLLSGYRVIRYWIGDTKVNNATIAYGTDKIETDYISNFFGKSHFINLNGAIRNLIGQREMNGVVKLENGYLLTTMEECPEEMIVEFGDAVVGLNHYLQEQNIPLLYAVTPYTSSKYDPQLPTGVEDYGNINTDRFLEYLESFGVATMDLRQLMYEDGVDQYSLMYRTDHHWTTEGGFYAYGKIADYLMETLDCKIDERVRDINNYTIVTYEDWHLGSRGQRTGLFYSGIDDFALFVPDFETSLLKGTEEGTLEELAYNMEPLSNKDYTSRFTYDYVLQDSISHFTNNLAHNDKRILVVGDSMELAVAPFLDISFREVMYLSNYQSYELTEELIDEYQPDAVVFLYYAGRITDGDNPFDFSFKNP